MDAATITASVEAAALRAPDRTSLLRVDGTTITSSSLMASVADVADRVSGVAPAGRSVAVVMPNGVEMAAAFLGVASATVCAPLNPTYTTAELTFFLDDLNAAALVTDGCSPAAIAEAERRGIPVLAPPSFEIAERSIETRRELNDVALILHTSGTTARPKQVPLTHANLTASAANVANTLRLDADDRCLNVMPLFHIHGVVAALLASLTVGGSVICAPGFDAGEFFEWATELGASWYTAVPTIHQAVLGAAKSQSDAAARCRFRLIRSSSASLPPSVMTELEAAFDAPVIEAYGMTEAAHQMASNPLPPADRKPGTVGLAAGSDVAVMAPDGTLLPAGAVGEVVVKGPTVTAGYVGDPAVNQAAFAHGWFHTGDQGVLDTDGYLTLTGRLKELINRGGEKIGPREVEEVLLGHPDVAAAVAFAVPHPTLGEDVGAAIVPFTGRALDHDDVRRHAAAVLAPHKVPQRIVTLDALPTGATGKVQRVGLAVRLGLTGLTTVTSEAPASRLEADIAALWCELIGLDEVGRHDRFVEVGGDSLTAVTLIVRIEHAFGVTLPLTAPLEEAPTVAQMAELIERVRASGGTPSRPEPSAEQTAVSFAQERMWVLQALDPDSAAYNVSFALRVHGPLEHDALAATLTEITRRHEALRSTFPARNGRPTLDVRAPSPFPLALSDVSDHTDPLPRAMELARTEAGRPFDLSDGPVLRGSVYRMAYDDHLLLLVAHHVATDGWSRGILRDELAAIYPAVLEGRPSPLAEVAFGYPALAAAQRRHVDSGALEDELAFWRERLDPVPPPVLLPPDRPRVPLRAPDGDVVTRQLGANLRADLADLARNEDATLFMALLAGFVGLLHRHTGLDDIVVGIPVAGRLDPRSERVIGPFLNTIPVRIAVDAQVPFRELLARTRAACIDAYQHQSVPFERLVEEAAIARALDHAPLVQVLFQLRNLPAGARQFGPLTVDDVDVPTGAAKLDLSVDVSDTGEGLTCRFDYPTALFDQLTIERFGTRFDALLTAATATPDTPVGALDILDADARTTLAELATEGDLSTPSWTVPERIASRAEKQPDVIAVHTPTGDLSYAELLHRADALAGHLVDAGFGPGSFVGICLPRTTDLLVAVLAVMRSGAAFVPLDPTYPAPRLAAVAEAAGTDVIISVTALADVIPTVATTICLDAEPPTSAAPLPRVDHDSAAYAIATSGSTGTPKCVVVEHRSLTAFIEGFTARLELDDDIRVLATTPISFDASFRELILPLVVGGTVVLAPQSLGAHPRAAADLATSGRASIVQGTPTTLRSLLDSGWRPTAGTTVLSSGEVLAPGLAERLVTGADLWNLYGPTESTMVAVAHHVTAPIGATALPIGRPLPGVIIEVVDERLEVVPPGIVGEIVIGGPGVARGYTTTTDPGTGFVDLPRGRRYRSGDRGRWSRDGELEYLGRIDDQFKVNGVRVEAGDVEVALAQHPAVADAVAAPRDARLVAWVTATAPVDQAELRRHAAALLPSALVPSTIVVLDEMPVLLNGKVDRSALPTPARDRTGSGGPPATIVEEHLALLWAAALEMDGTAGRDDDFFELGGSSLRAIALMVAIERHFGRHLPLAQCFLTPTLAGMAEAVANAESEGTRSSLVRLRDGDADGPVVLWVPGAGGTTLGLHVFASALRDGIDLYGFEGAAHRGLPHPESLEDMAASYGDDALALLSGTSRPVVLGGHSVGAAVAFEMARYLSINGVRPERLVLVDPLIARPWQERLRKGVSKRLRARRVLGPAIRRVRGKTVPTGERARRLSPLIAPVAKKNRQLTQAYRPGPFDGAVVLVSSTEWRERIGDDRLRIGRLVTGAIESHSLPGPHRSMLADERVHDVVAIVAKAVDELR